MKTQSRPLGLALVRIAAVTAGLLLIPLIAMQFTREVNWSLFDFLVAGVLIFTTGLIYELIVRGIHDVRYRIAATATLLLAFLYIWAELAVGIFTNWGS